MGREQDGGRSLIKRLIRKGLKTTEHSAIEEAATTTPADEARQFDQFFAIDRERDLAGIQTIAGRIKRDQRFGRVASKYEAESYKARGELKYSDEQIAGQRWEKEDYDLAVEELKQDKIREFFNKVSRGYENSSPIIDSIVRLDQEKAIGEELDSGTPVLIRGNWRMGKTSMVFSLISHRYGRANSVAFDMSLSSARDNDIDTFRDSFYADMSYTVAKVIAAKKHSEVENKDKRDEEEKVREEIEKSGKDGSYRIVQY